MNGGILFKKTTATLIAVFGVLVLLGVASSLTVITEDSINTTYLYVNDTQHIRTPYVVVCEAGGECDYETDGTADDVQIQNAINSLGTDGGEVYIMSGAYTLASDVDICATANGLVSLQGAGMWSTVLTYSGSNNAFYCSYDGSQATIKISDMRIEGTSALNVISLNNSQNGVFENLRIGLGKDAQGTGIKFNSTAGSGAFWNKIDNVYIRNGEYGIHLTGNAVAGHRSSNNYIGGSYITNSSGAGIWIEAGLYNDIYHVDLAGFTASEIAIQIDDQANAIIKSNEDGGDGILNITDHFNEIIGSNRFDIRILAKDTLILNYNEFQINSSVTIGTNETKISSNERLTVRAPSSSDNTREDIAFFWTDTTRDTGVLISSDNTYGWLNSLSGAKSHARGLKIGYGDATGTPQTAITIESTGKIVLNNAIDDNIDMDSNNVTNVHRVGLVANTTPICSAGVYSLFRDSSDDDLKYCDNGVVKDLY